MIFVSAWSNCEIVITPKIHTSLKLLLALILGIAVFHSFANTSFGPNVLTRRLVLEQSKAQPYNANTLAIDKPVSPISLLLIESEELTEEDDELAQAKRQLNNADFPCLLFIKQSFTDTKRCISGNGYSQHSYSLGQLPLHLVLQVFRI